MDDDFEFPPHSHQDCECMSCLIRRGDDNEAYNEDLEQPEQEEHDDDYPYAPEDDWPFPDPEEDDEQGEFEH